MSPSRLTLAECPNTVFEMFKFRSSLWAGDILLGLGVGETSDAIVALDGGTYSHAAIWSGDGIIESTTPNVVEWSIEQSLSEQPRVFIDVYRHRNARAGAGAAIVAEARRFVGRPYSYGDLFLGAFLVASSNCFDEDADRVRFLRYCSSFNAFFELAEENPDELVTCVELVVRACLNAGQSIRVEVASAGRLDLNLLAAGLLHFAVGQKDAEADVNVNVNVNPCEAGVPEASLREQFARKLLRIVRARRAATPTPTPTPTPLPTPAPTPLPTPAPTPFVAVPSANDRSDAERVPAPDLVHAGPQWGANIVTPRQLATSPDLEFQYRLYDSSPVTPRARPT